MRTDGRPRLLQPLHGHRRPGWRRGRCHRGGRQHLKGQLGIVHTDLDRLVVLRQHLLGGLQLLPSSDTASDECFDVTGAANDHRHRTDQPSIVLGYQQHRRGGGHRQCRRWQPHRHGELLRVRTDGLGYGSCSRCTATKTGRRAVALTAGAGNTSTATSAAFTPTSAGYWCFARIYSGDSNYTRQLRSATGECFHVTAALDDHGLYAQCVDHRLRQPFRQVTVTGNAAGGSPTGGRCSSRMRAEATVPSACTSQTDHGRRHGDPQPGPAHGNGHLGVVHPDLGRVLVLRAYSGDRQLHRQLRHSTDECVDVTLAPTTTKTVLTNSTITLGQAGDRRRDGDPVGPHLRQSPRNGDLLRVRASIDTHSVHLDRP